MLSFEFLGALAIGLSLGLLGSGGSILTVPVLVLLVHRPDKLAIAESLAIVGTIAIAAAAPYAFRRLVHWNSVLFFGLTGMLGAYFGALGARYVDGTTQLLLFGLVMITAAWFMFFGPKVNDLELSTSEQSYWLTMANGFLVGSMTGFLGIGGGFLIVPALVLLCSLSMRLAIGTSLVIIAMNSLIGFIEQSLSLAKVHMHVDWHVIGLFAVIGVLGSWTGGFIGVHLPQQRLRQLFSVAIFAMGVLLLVTQG